MKLFKMRNKGKTGMEKSGRQTKPFEFYGTGKHSKTIDEHQSMNKEEADQAFKKYKREILDAYFKEKGFYKHKTSSYVRLNKNRLVEEVNLQKEAYGSRTFTLNISLYPLYVPYDRISHGFGDRIGSLAGNIDFWWDYKDDKTAKRSFENVKDALEQFAMPWFVTYEDEAKYREDLINRTYTIGYDCILWITPLFLKQGNKKEAIKYLDDIKKDDYVFDHYKQGINPYALKNINKMSEILGTTTDIKSYLMEVEKRNVEKFKLPKGFLK